MKKKNVHVVPKGDNWAVKSAGCNRPAKVTTTQKKLLAEQERWLRIMNQRCWCMVEMVGSARRIHLVTTQTHLKVSLKINFV